MWYRNQPGTGIGAGVVTGLLVLALIGCGPKPTESELRARLQEVTGTVLVNGKPARVGDIMSHGDSIETGADSSVHLLLEKRGGLSLRAYSRLRLDHKEKKLSLGLERGDLITAFHKIKANEDISVVTPTAVAGVRGTHFFIKVHHDDHVYVCTCNGKVHYQGHGHDEGHVVEAGHHAAHHYRRVNGVVERALGEMEHHENHELERTAQLIGKEIAWKKSAN